jgi:hypothetical protein
MSPSAESGNWKAKPSAASDSFSLNGRLKVCAGISAKPCLPRAKVAREGLAIPLPTIVLRREFLCEYPEQWMRLLE